MSLDAELTEEATIRKFRIVQTEGSRQANREVIHYNLQMIIAVGFKVNKDHMGFSIRECVENKAIREQSFNILRRNDYIDAYIDKLHELNLYHER